MRTSRIVTSFLRDGDRFLIVRRSFQVRTMRGLWAGISGTVEGDEAPQDRAVTEIREETGITRDGITQVRAGAPVAVGSPRYPDHGWEVFPFLFSVAAPGPRITLNWENTEYRWVAACEIARYDTVPDLGRILYGLLR